MTPRVVVRAPPSIFASWLPLPSCPVLAVPLWTMDAQGPGSDDAIKGADGVFTAVGGGGMSADIRQQLPALPMGWCILSPDGKWCVGTLMTTIVL